MGVVHGNSHVFKGTFQSQVKINFPFPVFSSTRMWDQDRGVSKGTRGIWWESPSTAGNAVGFLGCKSLRVSVWKTTMEDHDSEIQNMEQGAELWGPQLPQRRDVGVSCRESKDEAQFSLLGIYGARSLQGHPGDCWEVLRELAACSYTPNLDALSLTIWRWTQRAKGN